MQLTWLDPSDGATPTLDDLTAVGIHYERLEVGAAAAQVTLDALKASRGYLVQDEVALTPEMENLEAICDKFKDEHLHTEDEVRFVLDSETSDPTDVGVYELKEANSMVEEFMLLANITVARETTRAFPKFACLRRHPAPTPGSFDGLARSLAQHGHTLDASS